MKKSTMKLTTTSKNIELLDIKIKEMKEIETSKWLSNGKISLTNGQVDIKTEISIEKLAMGFANVRIATKAIEDAYAELGIESYPVVRIGGNTVEEVKHDILLRKKIIEQKETMDTLTTLKNEWGSING
jgi:hypothetical protein